MSTWRYAFRAVSGTKTFFFLSPSSSPFFFPKFTTRLLFYLSFPFWMDVGFIYYLFCYKVRRGLKSARSRVFGDKNFPFLSISLSRFSDSELIFFSNRYIYIVVREWERIIGPWRGFIDARLTFCWHNYLSVY